jgi:hypothetical protein
MVYKVLPRMAMIPRNGKGMGMMRRGVAPERLDAQPPAVVFRGKIRSSSGDVAVLSKPVCKSKMDRL